MPNQTDQVSRMLSADKATLHSALLEGPGQRQAAHDVASAYLQRGVSAEDDMHFNPQMPVGPVYLLQPVLPLHRRVFAP